MKAACHPAASWPAAARARTLAAVAVVLGLSGDAGADFLWRQALAGEQGVDLFQIGELDDAHRALQPQAVEDELVAGIE